MRGRICVPHCIRREVQEEGVLTLSRKLLNKQFRCLSTCLLQQTKRFVVRIGVYLLVGNGDPGAATAKMALEHLAPGMVSSGRSVPDRAVWPQAEGMAPAEEQPVGQRFSEQVLSFTKFCLRPVFRAPVPRWAEPCDHTPCHGAGAPWTLQSGKSLRDTWTPFLLSCATGM